MATLGLKIQNNKCFYTGTIFLAVVKIFSKICPNHTG
jgi:hypothetical protein